jgi:hypothetical protein
MTDLSLAWTLAGVACAYLVFGITAFGASMVALPFLVQALPLTQAVPLMLLCDLVATPLVGLPNRKRADRAELRRLMPTMLLGVALGSTVLAQAPARPMLWLLAVFMIGVSAQGLLRPQSLVNSASALWASPAGLIGGVFSALFGTGGPVYTSYLARRMTDFEAFRATTALLILTSAACRLLTFLIAGLLVNPQVWRLAVWAVPTCLAALWVGTRLRHRIDPQRLRHLVLWLLLLAGVSVAWRAAHA